MEPEGADAGGAVAARGPQDVAQAIEAVAARATGPEASVLEVFV
jgi:hypothetical protein